MNIERICIQACQVIKETAIFLKSELGKVSAQEIEFKERNHLVSYVDKTSEKMLIEELGHLLPDASFLAEEETVKHEEKDWHWIIDPLDGTTNFLHHLPFFAISVALQHEGKTVLGIVHSIMQDETLYSYGENKSFLNN